MITIFCALFQEAKFVIDFYQLKKNTQFTKFQIFEHMDNKVRVVITGVGMVQAAAAVAAVSTMWKPQDGDLMCNIGSCGAGDEALVGKTFVITKIIEKETGRTFYPDILYQHGMEEDAVISCMAPVTEGPKEDSLVDMEAAALYQAGNLYYGPHQMIFIKTVSDCGIGRVEKEQFVKNLKGSEEIILDFLAPWLSVGEKEIEDSEEEVERLCEELHCSTTMKHELEQYLRYYALSGISVMEKIEQDRMSGMLPCKDKKEGKRYLERIKQWLF